MKSPISVHVHATMPESQSHTTVQEDVATPLLEPEEVEGLESEEKAPETPNESPPGQEA